MTATTKSKTKSKAPKIKLDPEELTLDELEEFENVLADMPGGGGFDTAFAKGSKRAPAMKIIAWLILKRDDPELTLADAGKVKLGQFDLDDADADDKEAEQGKG